MSEVAQMSAYQSTLDRINALPEVQAVEFNTKFEMTHYMAGEVAAGRLCFDSISGIFLAIERQIQINERQRQRDQNLINLGRQLEREGR